MLLFLTGLTGFFYFILFYPVILSKTPRLFMEACWKQSGKLPDFGAEPKQKACPCLLWAGVSPAPRRGWVNNNYYFKF